MVSTASVFFESASELATLKNTFKVGGAETDPTTVSLTVTTPTNVATTYTFANGEITKVSTGVYKKDIACSEDGEWEFVWTGTGAAADVAAGTWTVFSTSLGKLYPTVEALKSRKGIALTDTKDDYELHTACFTASRAIEEWCGRVFYRSAAGTVRAFEAKSYYCVEMPAFNDIVSVSALKTDASGDGTFETTWATSDYQLLWQGRANPTAYPEPRPYDEIRAVGGLTFPYGYLGALAREDRVQVTGVFGWPQAPWPVKQAALILAEDIFDLKDSVFKSGGFNEFGRIRARQNPHVVMLCGPYRRAGLIFPVRSK